MSPSPSLTLATAGGMLLLALLWGLSIPVTKLGLVTMPPITLTALRFATALPLLYFFVLGRPALPWKVVPGVAALGILGIGIGQVTQSLGVVGTSASAGTVITATIPLFVVIFAALRLKQGVTLVQSCGLLAAFIGIILIAGGNEGEPGTASETTAAGVALLLVSAVAIAFYYVWSVELTHKHGMAAVAASSTFFGFLGLLPFAAWEAAHTPFTVTSEALLAAAYLGFGVSAVGLFLWLWLLRKVPARMAASVQFLQPVFGVAASALMFGDSMGLLFLGGVCLILLGLALAMTTRKVELVK